jgi:hypothetical protein
MDKNLVIQNDQFAPACFNVPATLLTHTTLQDAARVAH